MSRSVSPPLRRSGADELLGEIDSALNAAEVTMCFCGCGRLVDETRPSMYFYAQGCHNLWHRSQREDDPEGWRAEWRSVDPDIREYVEMADAPDPGPIRPRRTDAPSAMDALDRRAGFRRPPTPEEQDAAAGRPAGFTRRALNAFRDFLTPPARQEFDRSELVTQSLRALVMDGGELREHIRQAQQAEEDARRRLMAETWSITYVSTDFHTAEGATHWRVDVGDLSEVVYVGPQDSHHAIVMGCVNRLREQQRGRLD